MSALLRWQSQLIDAITAPEAPSPLPAGLSQPGLDAYRGNARLLRKNGRLADRWQVSTALLWARQPVAPGLGRQGKASAAMFCPAAPAWFFS